MTDRRTRPPIRCAEPGCPFSGYWQASRGYCPSHYGEVVDHLRRAVDTAQATALAHQMGADQ